ncbi:MAG: hypothetical protein BRD24_01355 [Halobacteriales archaeon SW_9_67_24]|nr:MAG: hypothetical protein BRD24_01355 [Halobacteriales archaeon SW_9_67_24]
MFGLVEGLAQVVAGGPTAVGRCTRDIGEVAGVDDRIEQRVEAVPALVALAVDEEGGRAVDVALDPALEVRAYPAFVCVLVEFLGTLLNPPTASV